MLTRDAPLNFSSDKTLTSASEKNYCQTNRSTLARFTPLRKQLFTHFTYIILTLRLLLRMDKCKYIWEIILTLTQHEITFEIDTYVSEDLYKQIERNECHTRHLFVAFQFIL